MNLFILLTVIWDLSFYIVLATNCQSNKIVKRVTTGLLDGEIEEYFYKKNSSCIFIRDSTKQVFWSKDDGATFEKIHGLENIIKLYPNTYDMNRIYALSGYN